MSDEGKNNESKTGKEFSDKADELFEKSKDFADKAEDFIADKVKKFKESNAFERISNALGKAEEVMETKSREFQSGEMGAKFDVFKEKAEVQASELLKRAKDAGRKIGDQVEDSLDAIKGKKDRTNNQNGGGI